MCTPRGSPAVRFSDSHDLDPETLAIRRADAARVAMVQEAVREAKANVAGLAAEQQRRFEFRLQLSNEDAIEECLQIARTSGEFKIGITADPAWRMNGGMASGSYVEGHKMNGYDKMIVLAARMWRGGPWLEKDMINAALCDPGVFHKCNNKRGGGGGISAGQNAVTFLYIVVKPVKHRPLS